MMLPQRAPPKTFGEAVGQVLQSIADRPPILYAALTAAVNAITNQVNVLEPYELLITVTVGPLFGYLASRLTVGPETAGTLAEGIIQAKALDAKPNREAIEKAEMVLNMPNVRKAR